MGMGSNTEDAADEAVGGAERASKRYAEEAQKGIDYAKDQQNTGRADTERYYKEGQGYLDPYISAGKSGIGAYTAGLGLGDQEATDKLYNQFRNSPGYQAALKEGQKAVERSAAAGGRTQSGALLKQLSRYGQDYADQQYGRYMDRMGALAGMGAQAAGQASGQAVNTGYNMAGIGQNYANMIGNWHMGIGQSYADSELAAANARAYAAQNKSSPWAGIGSLIGGAAGTYFGGPAGGAVGAQAGGAIAGGNSGASNSGGGSMPKIGDYKFLDQ